MAFKNGGGRTLDIDRGETRRAARRAAKRRKLINRQSFGPTFDRMNCLDCAINVVAVGDYYMVNKDVWEGLGLSWPDNLCIPCLERRLGCEVIGSEEIAPNRHLCDDPDRGLMAPHSLPGRRFRFSELYIKRMMTRAPNHLVASSWSDWSASDGAA